MSKSRWGTAKEYGAYYKLLLTESARKEFRWWLERENPELFRLVQKELPSADRK